MEVSPVGSENGGPPGEIEHEADEGVRHQSSPSAGIHGEDFPPWEEMDGHPQEAADERVRHQSSRSSGGNHRGEDAALGEEMAAHPQEEADERVRRHSFPRSAAIPSRYREEDVVNSFPRSAAAPARMRDGPLDAPPLLEAGSADLDSEEPKSPAYRVLQIYSRQVLRRPWLIIFLTTLLVAAILGPLFRIPTIEFDFSTFIRADGDSMLRREAYILALEERKGPNARRLMSSEDGPRPWHAADSFTLNDEDVVEVLQHGANASRRLFAQLIYTRSLTLIYESQLSIFNKQVLRAIGDFEVQMRNLPGWRSLCGRMASNLREYCDPGVSLMSYAWATQVSPTSSETSASRFVMQLDGDSKEPIPTPAFLAYIKQGGHPILDFRRFFPTSYVPPEQNGTGDEAAGELPTALRSNFFFAFDVTGNSQSEISNAVDQAKLDWEALVTQELYPLLKAHGLKVRYAGDFITSFELVDTLQSDLSFAIGSVFFVLLCLWFQLQAIWMSFSCLFVILLSLPVAFVLTPAEKLTATSFLALFLIVGIGSDTVFVYVDIWEQEKKRPLEERLPTVLATAGVNCLATSLTTAASFLANLASVLQPLREFGFFMGLCVLWCFVLITLYLPPMLVIQARKKTVPVETREVQVYTGVLPDTETAQQAPETQAVRTSRCSRLVRSYIQALSRKVAFCPGVVLVVSISMVVLFCIGLSLDITLATGVPEVFPAGHNQVDYPILEAQFTPIPRVDIDEPAPPSREAVCEASAPWQSSMQFDCSLFWCDQQDIPSTEECWSSGVQDLSDCSTIALDARVAATTRHSSTTASTVLRALAQSVAGTLYSQTLQVAASRTELSTLVMESWSSGSVVTSRFFRLGSASIELNTNASQACSAQVLCFWSVPRCSLGYTPLGNFSRRLSPAPAPLESLEPAPRLLQALPTVAANKQIDVTVLWGIRAPLTIPLLGPNAQQWSFDPHFQMRNPWAQRAVAAMCAEAPAELLIIRNRCWIEDLQTYLRRDSKRFPSRNFYSEVTLYSVSNLPMQEQLWIVDDTVTAVSLNFYADFAFDVGAEAVLEYKDRWDRYVDGLNARASATGNMAWHTAQAWVSAEAEVAILNSTIVTIIVAAMGGFACMLIFTLDFLLAFLVLILVLGVIVGLAFFMVVVMGWPIGPIEVIALVVFVGYSVTYSLHVAHIFREVDGSAESADREPSDLELRTVRVQTAMMRIGLSTLSSTLSTVGASAFLLLATMQIFTKLGFVVLVVSLLSCVASLVILPAVLIICGPSNRPCREKCCGKRKRQ